ncbi:MAG TPA: hypothetical protein DIT48_08215 [Actinobacteria bacterium]|nr:hypothetical protein [Actinomycetota bacterium]HCP62351.1 hypothetical protein [Actinomycetota bacterium]
MFSRRRDVPPRIREAVTAFLWTVELVEEGKEALLLASPTGRRPGAPLASSLAAFESALSRASDSMPAWRIPEMEEHWVLCSTALGESSQRAEHLRLEANPEGYEQLYGLLADLMSPLEAFAAALERFRGLGL